MLQVRPLSCLTHGAAGLTFQQVHKYEMGRNRIRAGCLQHIFQFLQVPVSFFFEGAPAWLGWPAAEESVDSPSSSFVSDFLATSEGLDLVRAFTCIEDAKLRRANVRLVEEMAPETVNVWPPRVNRCTLAWRAVSSFWRK